MQLVTLSIGLIAGAMAFLLTPLQGLVIYIIGLAWYPTYLTVQCGSIDFTVGRIIIMAVVLNILLRTDIAARFKTTTMDKFVVLFFVAQVIAGVTTTPLAKLLENRAGAICDLLLPYFAVRMLITTRPRYLHLLKCIMLISCPLAILGLYQSLTGDNPVGFLKDYYGWDTFSRGYSPIPRAGFYRADVTFPMSIMFGLFFAITAPVCAGVIKSKPSAKAIYYTAIAIMLLGVFSSMSSAPMLTALLAGAFILFYKFRAYWKPVLITLIVMCTTVEAISNRHFYDVLGSFTISPGTAWYRSRLLDVALFEGGMSGHWLAGYGLVAPDPGWGQKINHKRTDIVNHYLLILCKYGILGLTPLLVIIALAFTNLTKAYRSAVKKPDQWIIWCLLAALVSTSVSLQTVSLFGQTYTVLFIIFALCASAKTIITPPQAAPSTRMTVTAK